MSCFGKKHTDKQPSMHIDAAESMAESGAVSGGTAVHAAKGYKKLGEQVRLCEASWSNDCYRVASGECHPEAVSLVGISGPIRNSQLLYGVRGNLASFNRERAPLFAARVTPFPTGAYQCPRGAATMARETRRAPHRPPVGVPALMRCARAAAAGHVRGRLRGRLVAS